MAQEPVYVIGGGKVASAIAARLLQAKQNVVHLGLGGGERVDLPHLTLPKQVWSAEAQKALPAAPAVVVQQLKLDFAPDNRLQLSVDGGAPVAPAYIVIASARAAAKLMPQLNLKLPVRPVRCHVLPLNEGAKVDPVTYLAKGGIYFIEQPPAILYDGLLDGRQASFLPVQDLSVQDALETWLAKRGIEPAGAPRIVTTATTPDFLPAFGNWAGQPQLWLATGWHIWGPTVAGSVADKLCAIMLKGESINDIDMSRLVPARFHDGNWQKTARPAWLPEHPQPQLVGGLKEITRADTVNMIDSPKLERAGTVRTIDTPKVERGGGREAREKTRPKVQAGGLAQMAKQAKAQVS